MNRKIYSFVKKTMVILLGMMFIILIYVMIENRNSKEMTLRQKFLKTAYPILMKFGNRNKVTIANLRKESPVSFYTLKSVLNNGETFSFEKLKGKKVLIVNTASDCGYTPQYEELQQLYETHKDKLEILAFPSNDYKQQEKGNNEDIASFCKKNYGVSFPLMQKTFTKKSENQDPVYQWLTDSVKNGWNEKTPKWNFAKYLVNEKGQLTHYFDPAVSPNDDSFLKAISE